MTAVASFLFASKATEVDGWNLFAPDFIGELPDVAGPGLGLQELARIIGQATSGLAPKMLLMTPVEAVRKLLTRTGWRLEDVDRPHHLQPGRSRREVPPVTTP